MRGNNNNNNNNNSFRSNRSNDAPATNHLQDLNDQSNLTTNEANLNINDMSLEIHNNNAQSPSEGMPLSGRNLSPRDGVDPDDNF